MSIAKRLKSLRNQKRLSVSEVAARAEVPISSYQEWEQGRQIRNVEVYLKLSQALDISLMELITGKTPDQERQEVMNRLQQASELLLECRNRLHSFDFSRQTERL